MTHTARTLLPWGCWTCGSVESRVADSDVDEDGVRVRLRQCLGCAAYWDTEERRLSHGSYFGRASRRRKTEQRRRKSEQRTCRLCHGPFRGGTFAKHRAEPLHAREVANRKERRRLRQAVISRRWYEQDRRNARTMARMERVA